ncbi:trypsin-like serine peptidase [Microtetraspora malaysiensis]|uniref:trypsin-like serine peptidase n=1 Tax=Microtetraspora malaysiensis TaxID=161358 RepID=UPI003D8D3B2D
MKRSLAFGGLVATAGLLAAGLATPAQATNTVSSDTLANTNLAAQEVAAFWYGEAKANLINATPYGVETTKVTAKHVSTGGPSADTKPGVVPAIGDEKKVAAKSKNVNLPKTSGKVFFIGADNRPHWCTATSVQSGYKNLVATAGHCVYDTGANAATLDRWVFVPGYYQGKTPWGIYVGKQAFTHYDYDVYEDGDRDYAFVTVYNGVLPESVSADRNYESKVFRTRAEAEKELRRLQADKSTGWSDLKIVEVRGGRDDHHGRGDHRGRDNDRGRDHDRGYKVAVTVSEFSKLNPGKDLTGNGPWALGTGADAAVEISKGDYRSDRDSYVSRDGSTLYFRTAVDTRPGDGDGHHHGGGKGDGKGGWGDHRDVTTPTPSTESSPTATPTPTATSDADRHGDHGRPERVYKYFKRTFWATKQQQGVGGYKIVGRKLAIGLKDVGRLGDNVGGQGLAYNQKLGKPVFVFGYPSGTHPDGNNAFTGKTLKYSYGKTFAAQAPEIKGEELQGIKSPFTGEGSIGSSWLLNYQSARRVGYLNGVTIGLADTDKNGRIDTSLSPYFDGETYGVYKAAANLWSGKIV